MRKLTRNSARCLKCGVIMESKHHHDFVMCKCGNGIDGGLDYLRRIGNLTQLENLSEYEKTDELSST